MLIETLEIAGLRGFAQEQTLGFAQPNGKEGSGLTILVGPNSGGKSTIVESIHAFSGRVVSFSEGKRNKLADDRVLIRLKDVSGKTQELRTVDTGGSMTTCETDVDKRYYVLPSRRFFSPYFGLGGDTSREDYLSNRHIPPHRSNQIGDFAGSRLSAALKRRKKFDAVLGRVMNPVPDWTIDQSDEGSYYVKLNSAGQFHNSDGMGEGIVSLLFIIDALYDSSVDDLIVIDEPELSLHPVYQRRLARLFADFAKDRQIVLATHSPYFVDFEYIFNGAEVARVHKDLGGCLVSQLTRETTYQLEGLLENLNNPHLLGLEAREAFFQEYGVIVLEGQEDVVYYSKVFEQLVVEGDLPSESAALMEDCLFGWGAGGAGNIEKIVAILRDLGFRQVVAVFDQNERGRICELQRTYPNFLACSIPADDVKTKKDKNGRIIQGLLDEKQAIRPELKGETVRLFNDICEHLQA